MMVTPTNYQPDLDVAERLSTVVSSLNIGENLFAGPVRAAQSGIGGVPNLCVFVLATAGAASRPIKGGADERRPTVQITIRSDMPGKGGAFQASQALARTVYHAIDKNPPAGYCECRAVSSHPLYIGEDDEGRHEWTINLTMTVDVTA